MRNFYVAHETLTDGSRVHDVMFEDGDNASLIYNAPTALIAGVLAEELNMAMGKAETTELVPAADDNAARLYADAVANVPGGAYPCVHGQLSCATRERADAAVQWNRANQAEEDRDISQGHAIDQDRENEALRVCILEWQRHFRNACDEGAQLQIERDNARADLDAVPAWVKTCLRAWYKLVDGIAQPDPRG